MAKKYFGIIGAMSQEVDCYRDSLSDIVKHRWFDYTFYEGKLKGRDVVVVKSEIGITHAALVTQKLIDSFDSITNIIFSGVAGALDKDLDIGDVVISESLAYHDLDARPFAPVRGQIPYTDLRFFEADEYLISLARKAQVPGQKIVKGVVLTGHQFLDKKRRRRKSYLTKEFNGTCVDMEGCAVAHASYVNGIPFLIIRSISDRADGRAVTDFGAFANIVANNNLRVLESILDNYRD